MRHAIALAALAVGCGDVGGGWVGPAFVADVGGDVVADAGASSWDWEQIPPPGECLDGHAEGVVEWHLQPHERAGSPPWTCAPRWVESCAAVTRPDGCLEYDCRDARTGCWHRMAVQRCDDSQATRSWIVCGCDPAAPPAACPD